MLPASGRPAEVGDTPRMANHMQKYGFLGFLTRQALLPLISMTSLSLKTTASQKLFLLPFCLLLIFTIALRSYLAHTRSIPFP